MVQAIVVVEVLVAERNTKHPLAQHVHHALATLPRRRARQRPGQTKQAIGLTQHQHTAVKRRLDLPLMAGWK